MLKAIPIEKRAGTRRAIAAFGLTLASITGFGYYWQMRSYRQAKSRWTNAQAELEGNQPFVLSGYNAKYYPWYVGKLSDWEHKLVKIRGYFKEERMLVKRERDGKEGYLVFAPFITATENHYKDKTVTVNSNQNSGLFVCLGWVPRDKKNEVTMGNDPVPLIEVGEGQPEFWDSYTQLGLRPSVTEDDDVVPMTEITAVVQPGEQETWLHRNWAVKGLFTVADLEFMTNFFRMWNRDAASTAYLERVITPEEQAELGEDAVVIPATHSQIQKGQNSAESQMKLARYWGLATGLSLLYAARALLI